MVEWLTSTKIRFPLPAMGKKLKLATNRMIDALDWLHENDYISRPEIDYKNRKMVSFTVRLPPTRGKF